MSTSLIEMNSSTSNNPIISNDDVNKQEETYNQKFCGIILTILSLIRILLTFPLSIFFCIRIIAQYKRAVIIRFGRVVSGGVKGPGLVFIIPYTDTIYTMDLRLVTFVIPPQEVLSKDSVTMKVDAIVYYRISNPVMAVMNVVDAHRSTQLLAQSTLRNVLGTKDLAGILAEREEISNLMQGSLDHATDQWGVKVERVEINDVRLPQSMQRAMAAEAEASRDARAKVVAAEGEMKSSKALKEASDIMTESRYAIQLRYLQTLHAISAEKNSTIVFPLPIDFISNLMNKL